MFSVMDQVLRFHEKMGQPIGDPRAPDIRVETDFRLALIEEEYRELQIAVSGFKKDPEEKGKFLPFSSPEEQNAAVADALGDLIYVIVGSAVAWGLDLGAVWNAIHESNMSKTPNPNGKTIKGEGWIPANIGAVLAESAKEFTDNPDYFGDLDDQAAWPTPRKQRVGSTSAELAQVKAETLPTAEEWAKELDNAAKQFGGRR